LRWIRLLELQQEALADPQLAIKELALLEPAMRLGITFKTEGSGRPKKVSQLGAALFLASERQRSSAAKRRATHCSPFAQEDSV
jgi:hypothetical protein